MKTERTSGSVFATLGYDNPEEAENKSLMVTALNDTITACGLTLERAAQMAGVDQPTFSEILSGRTRRFSIDKLAAMLTRLAAV